MSTKRPNTAGVGNAGLHHVGKIVSACNSIFQTVDQQNDVGTDAYIEFILDESSTGCCVAAQIKSGGSYIRDGHFILPADRAHFHYWSGHSLSFVGIVYDPETDVARWVDLTAELEKRQGAPPFTIHVPDDNVFDVASFPKFREQLLAYRSRYSDQRFLASALADLAATDDFSRRQSGLRSLFSFHRQRSESWFYLITTLRSFRDSPVLRDIIVTLCHIPGHMDIFWHRGNITDETTRAEAERLMRTLLTREDVAVLVAGIGEDGIGRGSIGQCVQAILGVVANRDRVLESVARDTSLSDETRYWALCLFVSFTQRRDIDACIRLASELSDTFSQGNASLTKELVNIMRQWGSVDFM